MKLDRNMNPSGRGKYALLKLRELGGVSRAEICMALETLEELSVAQVERAVDFGETSDSEFFVIRLKDKFAAPALLAYHNAIHGHIIENPQDREGLAEYARDISALVQRAYEHAHRQVPT